jgi:hypothetical protein
MYSNYSIPCFKNSFLNKSKKALLLGKPLCYILVTTKSSPLSFDRIIIKQKIKIVQEKHDD